MISIVDEAGVPARARALIRQAAARTLRLCSRRGDVCILLADDARLMELNRGFRGVNAPTDVLSFPEEDGLTLGDIAISVPTARKQAEALGHSFEREASFLAVHGTLHLLGFDHERDGQEARMLAAQQEVFARWNKVW